jgi:hypothetical protein
MPLLWSQGLTKHLLYNTNKGPSRTIYTWTLKTTSEPAVGFLTTVFHTFCRIWDWLYFSHGRTDGRFFRRITTQFVDVWRHLSVCNYVTSCLRFTGFYSSLYFSSLSWLTDRIKLLSKLDHKCFWLQSKGKGILEWRWNAILKVGFRWREALYISGYILKLWCLLIHRTDW